MLDKLRKSSAICEVGVCAYCDIEPFLTEEKKQKIHTLCKNLKSIIVCLFPYYTGQDPGNIALYARGMDYHEFIKGHLNPFCKRAEEELSAYEFLPLCDDSPIPEVLAAELSGVGIKGKNGMIFDEKYGSFVFIGTILTNLELTPTPRGGQCIGCDACVRACPQQALQDDGTVDVNRCLSSISQKNGELTKDEEKAIAESSLVWGCDICLLTCPMNQNVLHTPIQEFKEDCLHLIGIQDVLGLTRAEFKKKYPNRAFTFRGPAPVLRNILLQGKEENKDANTDL